LTGATAITIDFTEYQKSTFCSEHQEAQNFEQEEPWEEQNLFFEPSSSDTDSSEDHEYTPNIPFRKVISNTNNSWPDNSNSNLANQPSTSGLLPRELSNQNLDSNSSSESSDIDNSPLTFAKKTLTTKNLVDSRKNTAQTLWEPASKIIVNPDPEAISTST
jgi:hypothetical protein